MRTSNLAPSMNQLVQVKIKSERKEQRQMLYYSIHGHDISAKLYQIHADMAACSKVRPGVRVSEVIKLCKRLHIT